MPIRLVEKTSSSARHTPLATSLTPHERLRQGPVEDHVEVVAYDAKGCAVRALPDSLAEAVTDSGFWVHLPLLFGRPGDDRPIAFTAKLCISREFRVFAKNGGSLIVDWLRALCRKIKGRLRWAWRRRDRMVPYWKFCHCLDGR